MTSTAPVTPALRQWLKRRSVIAMAAGLSIGWLVSTFAVTWKLTHRLRTRQAEPVLDIAGQYREDLFLTTSDGEQLGAWLFEGSDSAPCALVMHGINSGRSQSRGLIERLVRRGCTVLAVTLRAHGDSTGKFNNIGWDARRDVIAAVEFLRSRYPERPVVICGRSMSSAAAIFAAAELGEFVSGYWLEQPYPTLDSALWHRLQAHLPPVFDWTAYVGMRMWAGLLLSPSIRTIAPVDHIPNIPKASVIWIVSGDADSHLPVADVETVFDRVRDRATLVLLPGAAHVLLDDADPVDFDAALGDFLDAVSRRRD